MATVRITLPRYNQSWDLPRERILTLIPESLIGQALQEELDVPEITLDYPDVTPEAMNVLAEILQGREPDHHVLNLSSSARYLNIPWLVYYEDPLYDQIERPSSPEQTYDTCNNQKLLVEAIESHHNNILKYLLMKGVSPVWLYFVLGNKIIGTPLEAAIRSDNLEAFQILMSDPRVQQLHSFSSVLASKMWRPNDPLNQVMGYILDMTPIETILEIGARPMGMLYNLGVVQRIYPRLTTQEQKDRLIEDAISNFSQDLTYWLLQQPGNTNYESYLNTAIEWSPDETLLNWLLNTVPDLTANNYALLRMALTENDLAANLILKRLDILPLIRRAFQE